MVSRKGKRPRREPALPPLHELEAEVMEELWSRGEASVRTASMRNVVMGSTVLAGCERAVSLMLLVAVKFSSVNVVTNAEPKWVLAPSLG